MTEDRSKRRFLSLIFTVLSYFHEVSNQIVHWTVCFFCLLDYLLPGGGTPHMKGVGMLVGYFELNPKGDRFGRGPSFFWPQKETMLKHRQYIFFYIFLRATLNETFVAKYDDVLPRTP